MIIRFTNQIHALIVLIITLLYAVDTSIQADIKETTVNWIDLSVYFLVVIYCLLSFNDLFYQKVARRREFIGKLNNSLQACVEEIEECQKRIGKKTLRANIMVIRKGKLKIISHFRMDYDPDLNLTFAPGQGWCGFCFETGKEVIADLAGVYKESWEETTNDSGSLWGITQEHYEKTRTHKTTISFPLIADNKVVGVINIYDKISMEKACFNEEIVHRVIGSYRYHIISLGSEWVMK